MVSVDKEKCIGCGACEATCPNVFKVKDGKATVIKQSNEPCVKQAEKGCPVDAIKA